MTILFLQFEAFCFPWTGVIRNESIKENLITHKSGIRSRSRFYTSAVAGRIRKATLPSDYAVVKELRWKALDFAALDRLENILMKIELNRAGMIPCYVQSRMGRAVHATNQHFYQLDSFIGF
ncbi:uncharacterized protein LOC110911085 [Helianthus annuus]|uniref:uncharacterized protein LOC110911085 n=1 Tax=Helianthus annuus TaxID=4232 RepID=UPI000B9057EB|nr:uncharacterized protein LOC110911085 [Helianthus annuus]